MAIHRHDENKNSILQNVVILKQAFNIMNKKNELKTIYKYKYNENDEHVCTDIIIIIITIWY